MHLIGSYEAKTRLSELLDKVSKGERLTITRHGVPIAHLVPAERQQSRPVREVIDDIKRLRKGLRVSDKVIRSLIEEGRS